MKKDALIIVRGGGDLATGTIHRLERRAAGAGAGNNTARSHPPSGSSV